MKEAEKAQLKEGSCLRKRDHQVRLATQEEIQQADPNCDQANWRGITGIDSPNTESFGMIELRKSP